MHVDVFSTTPTMQVVGTKFASRSSNPAPDAERHGQEEKKAGRREVGRRLQSSGTSVGSGRINRATRVHTRASFSLPAPNMRAVPSELGINREREPDGDQLFVNDDKSAGDVWSSCSLLHLPAVLLGRMWPPETVVAGRRVCKFLHRELQEHVSEIVLVRGHSRDFNQKALVQDLQRASHCTMSLKWEGLFTTMLLEAVLQSSVCQSMRSLQISRSSTGENGALLATVLRHCSTLVELDLSRSKINSVAMESISVDLLSCRKLARLDLSHNMISCRGAEQLARVLPQLQNVTHLFLGETSLGDAGLVELARVLGTSKTLLQLDVSSNAICGFGVEELVRHPFEALVLLDLHNNALGMWGGAHLAQGLAKWRSLAHVNLRHCALGTRGAQAVASAQDASSNDRVQLDLRINSIEKGVRAELRDRLGPWVLV